MRFATSGFILAATTTTVLSGDGECFTNLNGLSSYFTNNEASWLEELVLTAVYDKEESIDAPTDDEELSDNIDAMYADAAFGGPAAQNTDLSSTLDDNEFSDNCVACMLGLYTSVRAMIGYNLLPETCQDSANFGDVECRYALSDVIVAFDKCTGSTGASIGAEDAQLGEDGCTAQQIMQLDGEFNLYSTLIDKLVFDAETTAFDAAVAALPCHDVFDDWYGGFTAGIKTDLNDETVCGTRAGQKDLQYDSDCYNEVVALPGTTGDLEDYISELVASLGGGFSIEISDNLRCTANQATIISQLRPFGAIVKCSFDYDYAADANEWNDCMDGSWSSMSGLLAELNCFECFTDANSIAIAIDALKATDLSDCDGDSFASKCLNGTISNGLLDKFYQCSGVDLSIVDSVCTTAETEAVPAVLKSIVPIIALAKSVMNDNSLTNSEDRVIAAIDRLSELPSFESDSSAPPCMVCYGGLITQIVEQFEADSDLLTACDDEYATACLRNTFFAGETGGDAGVLDQFEACSGFALATTSSYTCDDDQYAFITDNNIPHKLFAQAMAEGTGATAASVISSINGLVADVLAANPTVKLPCANCVAELITGLFALDETTRAVCLAAVETPEICFGQSTLSGILKRYQDCSGHEFDAKELTNDDGAEEEDDTTDDSTDDTNSAATFGVGLTAAFGLFAAVAVL